MTINDIELKEDLIQTSDPLHQFSAEEFNTIVSYIKTIGQIVSAEEQTYFNIYSGMPEEKQNVFINTSQTSAILKFIPKYRKIKIDISGQPITTNIAGSSQATIVVRDQNYNVVSTLYHTAVYNNVNSVNIPRLLQAGTYYVTITMTVGVGDNVLTEELQFTVTSTSLNIQLASTDNWANPWKEYVNYAIGPYIITGSLDKTLHIKIKNSSQSKQVNINLGTDTYVENPYYYTLTRNQFLGNSEQVTIEAWITSGDIETNHILHNIMAIKSGQNSTARIVCINEVKDTVENGASNTMFKYCIYDGTNSTASITIHTDIKEGDNIYESYDSKITAQCQTIIPYDTSIDTDSDYSEIQALLKVSLSDSAYQTALINIDNSKSVPFTSGAKFVVNPARQDNGTLFIKNQVGSDSWLLIKESTNFKDGINGWNTDEYGRNALCLMQRNKIKILGAKPLNVDQLQPAVFDITYRIKNVINYNDPVIQLSTDGDNFVGLRIYPNKIVLHSNNKNNSQDDRTQTVNVPDEQVVNVQICLCPNYNVTYGNFAFIYVNGVKQCTFDYSNDSFSNSEYKFSIGSDYADVYVYSIKTYDKQFAFNNALDNYYSSLPKDVNKLEYKEFDQSIVDATSQGTVISYDKVSQLPSNKARNYFVISLENEADLPKYGKSKDYSCQCDFEMHYDNGYAFRLNNQKIEGQGTTSMNYWLWNFRWRIDKNNSSKTCDVQYSNDGVTWTEPISSKKVTFYKNGSDIIRITAKKNYASSMQSHKMGSTAAFNDLHDAVCGANEAGGRTAVYQYPAYGFLKIPAEGQEGRYIYKCIGLYTIGPDKGDKPTFGYDNATYKNTLVHLEGLDQDPKLTLFKYPWNSSVTCASSQGGGDTNISINRTGNSYQHGWEIGALFDLETDPSKDDYDRQLVIDKVNACFKPAYEVVYKNNPHLLDVRMLSDKFNSITKINDNYAEFSSSRYSKTNRPLTDFELYDETYNLYYYDLVENKYKTSGVNVINDLGISSSQISGMSVSQINDLIVQKRVERFRQNVGKYWNVDDALFHQQFCFIIAASDNNAKNIYPYSFNPTINSSGDATVKWRWRQDDLDTIFDIDNQGTPVKEYSVEPEDFTNDSKVAYVFKGEDSAFWTLLKLAYEDYDPDKYAYQIGAKILNEMAKLSSGDNTYEKLVNFFKKYYWDKAQNYFARSAYNADAKISYEDAYANYGKSYFVDTNPLDQSLGNHKESEEFWVRQRVLYCMSKYKVGTFGNYVEKNFGQISFRMNGSRSFQITPAIDLYPSIIIGANSNIINPGVRMRAGQTCTLTASEVKNSNVYITAADYIEDIGNLAGLPLDTNGNAELQISSKRLKKIDISIEDSSYSPTIKSLVINCPQLTELNAKNHTLLSGSIDLTEMDKIQKCDLSNTNITSFKVDSPKYLQELHLPASIKTLKAVNINKDAVVDVEGLSNVTSMYVDHSFINSYDYLGVNSLILSKLGTKDQLGLRLMGLPNFYILTAQETTNLLKYCNDYVNGRTLYQYALDLNGNPVSSDPVYIGAEYFAFGTDSDNGEITNIGLDNIEKTFPNVELIYPDFNYKIDVTTRHNSVKTVFKQLFGGYITDKTTVSGVSSETMDTALEKVDSSDYHGTFEDFVHFTGVTAADLFKLSKFDYVVLPPSITSFSGRNWFGGDVDTFKMSLKHNSSIAYKNGCYYKDGIVQYICGYAKFWSGLTGFIGVYVSNKQKVIFVPSGLATSDLYIDDEYTPRTYIYEKYSDSKNGRDINRNDVEGSKMYILDMPGYIGSYINKKIKKKIYTATQAAYDEFKRIDAYKDNVYMFDPQTDKDYLNALNEYNSYECEVID